jgi:N-acetylmuramoyl-L-alanine amidase
MKNKTIINISSGLVIGAVVHTMAEPVVPERDLNCMAMNVYHEARGEAVEGQIAVAHVTMNRVNHTNWPDDICGVVYEDKQFSWTHLINDPTPYDSKSWRESLAISRDVIIGNTVDPSLGAVFYHARWVNPTWTSYMEVSKVIGNHIFYVWDGDWNKEE